MGAGPPAYMYCIYASGRSIGTRARPAVPDCQCEFTNACTIFPSGPWRARRRVDRTHLCRNGHRRGAGSIGAFLGQTHPCPTSPFHLGAGLHRHSHCGPSSHTSEALSRSLSTEAVCKVSREGTEGISPTVGCGPYYITSNDRSDARVCVAAAVA